MKRSNKFPYLFIVLSGLAFLAGCSGPYKGGHPDMNSSKNAYDYDQSLAKGLKGAKGDGVTSLEVSFKKLDSARSSPDHASNLYVLALENFIEVGNGDPRLPEVMLWKANHLYNRGEFASAIAAYKDLLAKFPSSSFRGEATQMIAQSFAQSNENMEAEKWYRSLVELSGEKNRPEAIERVAQSVYLQAEAEEKRNNLEFASKGYMRVAKEFPLASIAPVALFNAGVMQERLKDFKAAILVYEQFFDAFYQSDLLPKVQFREAKCRELDGQWEEAGRKYLNLVKAHPASDEVEPAQYNAGFAFENGKNLVAAAGAFEDYAKRFPSNTEAPNILFRAAEHYGELKMWEKVSELQSLFSRRYSSDKTRLIQALCMGGTASFKQGKFDESARQMETAISEYASLKNEEASSRYYAAQAQHTLGDINAERMRRRAMSPGNREADLRAKTTLLKQAVDAYVKTLDYKIVDWTLRAAFSLGEAFQDYGRQVYEQPRSASLSPGNRLILEEEVTSALGAAYGKAQDQYASVLMIASKQGVNNKWVEDAKARLSHVTNQAAAANAQMVRLIPALMPDRNKEVEKSIALKLEHIEHMAPFQEQTGKLHRKFLEHARSYGLDSRSVDTAAAMALRSRFDIGRTYYSAAEAARSAPIPKAYNRTESFFYRVKLLQEGISDLESKGRELLTEGMAGFGIGKYTSIENPYVDSLKLALGEALYIRAKCLDLLSQEALANPPIPPSASSDQKEAFMQRFEKIGFELQDQSLEIYRDIIGLVGTGAIAEKWGEMAFARLYQIEPDKWTRAVSLDSVIIIQGGNHWKTHPGTKNPQWPDSDRADWIPAKKGAIRLTQDFPLHVRENPRFLWNGEAGKSFQAESVASEYTPWMEIRAQTEVELPSDLKSIELEVVAPREWIVMWNRDTLLTNKDGRTTWEKGATKDVLSLIANSAVSASEAEALSVTRPPKRNFLRIWSRNSALEKGYGVWIQLRIKGRSEGGEPVYPWNNVSPTKRQMQELRSRQPFILNFTPKENAPG